MLVFYNLILKSHAKGLKEFWTSLNVADWIHVFTATPFWHPLKTISKINANSVIPKCRETGRGDNEEVNMFLKMKNRGMATDSPEVGPRDFKK